MKMLFSLWTAALVLSGCGNMYSSASAHLPGRSVPAPSNRLLRNVLPQNTLRDTLHPLLASAETRPGNPRKFVSFPPLFQYERLDDGYDWYVLGGLFSRMEDRSRGTKRIGLPFYVRGSTPDEAYWSMFPLAYWRRKKVEDGFEREFSILGILYQERRRPGYFENAVLHPIFGFAKGREKGLNVFRLKLLPLFSYSHKWEPGGGDTGLKYEKQINILWPAFSYYRDNYGPGYQRVDVLWPIFRFTKGSPCSPLEKEITFYILPLSGWGKYWKYDESGDLAEYRSEFHLVDPFLSYERSTKTGLHFRLLGPLLAYSRTPGGDYDFKILVRTVRSTRKGTRRTFNLWPFFGTEWDRSTGERKTIILGGLFYYRRDAAGNKVKRILWVIPIGRRRPPQDAPAPGKPDGRTLNDTASPSETPADASLPERPRTHRIPT